MILKTYFSLEASWLNKKSYILGLIFISAICTQWLLYSQNNILNNKNWFVAKKQKQMLVVGADEFLLERSVLAKNQLDLSKYYGFQEVYTKKTFKPNHISLSFHLPLDGYLDLFLIDDHHLAHGIRLINSDSDKSFYFVKNKDKKFIIKQELNWSLKMNNWNLLKWNIQKNHLEIDFNGMRFKKNSIATHQFGHFGLYAGEVGAVIDDVLIEDLEGQKFYDDFSSDKKKWITIFFIHFVTIFGIVEILQLFILFFSRAGMIPFPYNIRSFLVVQLSIILIMLYGFDFYFWSSRLTYNHTFTLKTNEKVNDISLESIRFKLFRFWAQNLGFNKYLHEEIKKDYPHPKLWEGPILCINDDLCRYVKKGMLNQFLIRIEKNCKKLILTGSSQSVGSGAGQLDQSMFVQIHKKLYPFQNHHGCLVSLNLAVSGGLLKDIFHDYQTIVDKTFIPDVMILNISYNDTLDDISKYIPKVLRWNQTNKIKTILIEEANSLTSQNAETLTKKHAILKEQAIIFGQNSLPFHQELLKEKYLESGDLWWDEVHLTDWGQSIAADWLSSEIMKIWK